MTTPAARRSPWTAVAVVVTTVSVASAAGAVLRSTELADADIPATPASGVPSIEPTIRIPTERPGSSRVQFTQDVDAHPAAGDLRVLLQQHFDAINNRDYDLWASTVLAERAEVLPERRWRESYRSTIDQDIVAYRLEATPQGDLVVLLSFVSVQDEADAPPDTPFGCLRWLVSYSVERDADGALVLGQPSDQTASQKSACDD